MKKFITGVCLTALLCTGITAGAAMAGVLDDSGSGCFAWAAAADTESSASLKKPEITAKPSGYESIKVSWKKVSGAKKYEVYRASSKSGEYKKIASIEKLTYSDKKISQNKTYYYKVRAVSGSTRGKYSNIKSAKIATKLSLKSIPAYSGQPYVEVCDGNPSFSARMKSAAKESYETYSKLDSKKRPQAAIASIGRDLMPEGEREGIGMVKPAGFSTVRYDDLIEDKYLYNRCHMIGWQLTGENANEKNLITGTRYMNVEGMLPFENRIASYIKKTGNHVLYRVTPVYSGDDLVCRGLQMEAWSVEDKGKGLSFHVFVYNVQPGIEIDYADGSSRRADSSESNKGSASGIIVTPGGSGSSGSDSSSGSSGGSGIIADPDMPQSTYVLNKNSHKFHYASCSSVDDMSPKNKIFSDEDRDAIVAKGYDPCKRCNP